MNYLFVCTQNRWRSLTAEKIFTGVSGVFVRSAGTASNARRKICSTDITWANTIFVMEKKHQEILKEKFATEVLNKNIICLNIPDIYQFMDDELIKILQESVVFE